MAVCYIAQLSQLKFNEIIETTYNEFYDQQKTGHPLTVIFQSLFYMLFFHFPSIESLKKANRVGYGILIGQQKLPTPKVIHRALNQLLGFNRSSKLMREFACQFVKNNIIEVGLLYFDEHFLPYYGIEHIAAGFFSKRWGAQENIFKKMTRRYNINYHPGYYLEELINQPLIDNPKIKALKKTIKELESSIIKEKSNLATRMLNLKKVNISIEKYRQRQAKSIGKITEKQKELDRLKHKLGTLPEKVSILEVLAGKKMSQFDLEKKKIYDVIQIAAYNSEQMLLEILKKHYHNKRDIEQILDKIINHGGSIKLYEGKLYVLLYPIATPRYRRAAIGLCQEINQMQSRTYDYFRFPIFFKIRK